LLLDVDLPWIYGRFGPSFSPEVEQYKLIKTYTFVLIHALEKIIGE